MSAQDMPPPLALFRMISGFYVSRSIHVMARLGIADILNNGPVHAEDLARRTKTHAPSLKRVLRFLVTAGIVTEDENGRFGLTAIGDCLRIIARETPADVISRYIFNWPLRGAFELTELLLLTLIFAGLLGLQTKTSLMFVPYSGCESLRLYHRPL